jgi:hypothetical protein
MRPQQHASAAKLAIYYEHPQWFKPLFAELAQRGVTYDRLPADRHHYDPTERRSPYALVVNRMSPSAYTRGHTHAIAYTTQYLAYLQSIGANVVNGYDSYVYETSKARQLNLLEDLGLNYPRSRVINHPSQALAAADGLTFPIVIKSNIGGSGAGITRFDSLEALAEAGETIDLGLDRFALVQEFLPARDNSIIRVETLNGKFLYAIQVHLTGGDNFNLCPADYCDIVEAKADQTIPAVKALIESYKPPQAAIDAVERIVAEAQIDVGGVEYLVNDRDGQIYYYDINALSNFVANAPEVIGFDPFPKLVDYLLTRAGLTEAVAVA